MKMAPIYTSDGRLLGHLNVKDCVQTHDSIIVENLSRSPFSHRDFMNKTIEIFHVPLLPLRFRCESNEQKILCLVVDKLPDWFWDAYPTVRFSSDHWKRL